jgi:spermidine/putrescine transport system substrate-binding protein
MARALVAVALVLLSLAACQSGGSRVTSDALDIYTWSEYLPPEVVSDFEAANPGLTVTIATYDSNEEMLAGLEAEPGRYDLVFPSDYAVEILIEAGGLEPIEIGRDIRNFANILPAFRTPYFDPGGQPSRTGGHGVGDKYTVPFQWGTTGIAYDSSAVDLDITSFADLADAALVGRIGVLDDPRETLGMANIALGRDKNDGSEEALAAAVDWLNSIGIASVNSEDPETALLDGTVLAHLIYNGDAAEAISQNADIAYVLPEDAGIFFDNMAIPVGAPHRDAALAFMDHILEAEVSAEISRAYGYSTPNQAALEILEQTDPAFVADPISNPPPDDLLGLRLVKNVGPEAQARFVEAFDQVDRP